MTAKTTCFFLAGMLQTTTIDKIEFSIDLWDVTMMIGDSIL